METITEMLRTSPRAPLVSDGALADCIAKCVACAQSCVACADACVAEEDIEMLRRCIRLNLDCADICESTVHILSRQLDPEAGVRERQLELLAFICRVCGDECEQHADMHEHCRVCMEACRRCEESCRNLQQALAQGAPASQGAHAFHDAH